MASSGPPAYAWDWFARQRLLWREVRSRLVASAAPAAIRYGTVDSRSEVLALPRSDYARDDLVRRTVDGVVAEFAFLGRTHRRFDELGVVNPPRGLRWWWSALTGEELDRGGDARVTERPQPTQLRLDTPQLSPEGKLQALDDVHEGYGG